MPFMAYELAKIRIFMHISGEKIVSISDFIYTPIPYDESDYYKYTNTFNINNITSFSGIPIIYTHLCYIVNLFKELKDIDKMVIIISHNSDDSTPEISIPQCVKKWYSQNVSFKNNRLESIPVGLENSRWFPSIQKASKIFLKLNENKKIKNLLYVNHNVKTNVKERLQPYTLFKNKSWCSLVAGHNGYKFKKYIDNVYNHKFVLCPNGHGIDSHRLWECLYLKTIPVVTRSINTMFYQDLPICFVDNWEEIDKNFLENNFELIENKLLNNEYNLEKLKFFWWKNKIRDEAIKQNNL